MLKIGDRKKPFSVNSNFYSVNKMGKKFSNKSISDAFLHLRLNHFREYSIRNRVSFNSKSCTVFFQIDLIN
jgi:hypothetical protein